MVMKVEGFDKVTLVSVFDYLTENEKTVKAFLANSDRLSKL